MTIPSQHAMPRWSLSVKRGLRSELTNFGSNDHGNRSGTQAALQKPRNCRGSIRMPRFGALSQRCAT